MATDRSGIDVLVLEGERKRGETGETSETGEGLFLFVCLALFLYGT
jgi:hypothetical protein